MNLNICSQSKIYKYNQGDELVQELWLQIDYGSFVYDSIPNDSSIKKKPEGLIEGRVKTRMGESNE